MALVQNDSGLWVEDSLIPGRDGGLRLNDNFNMLGDRAPKVNAATTDPGINNDSTQLYKRLSRWVNTTTGDIWTCKDPAVGAAIWVRSPFLDSSGLLAARGLVRTRYIDPSSGSDSADGSSRSLAWATVAPTIAAMNAAIASNTRLELVVITRKVPLYLTQKFLCYSDGLRVIGEGANNCMGGMADLRPWKVLNSASFYQPNAATYPNVWAIADSSNAYSSLYPFFAEEIGWSLTRVHPLNPYLLYESSTVNLSGLNTNPFTFWSGPGGIIYFNPGAGVNPTTSGIKYVRSLPEIINALEASPNQNESLVIENMAVGFQAGTTPLGAQDVQYSFRAASLSGTSITYRNGHTYCATWHEWANLLPNPPTVITATEGSYARFENLTWGATLPQSFQRQIPASFPVLYGGNGANRSNQVFILSCKNIGGYARAGGAATGKDVGGIFLHNNAGSANPCFNQIEIRNSDIPNFIEADGCAESITINACRVRGTITLKSPKMFVIRSRLNHLPSTYPNSSAIVRNCMVDISERRGVGGVVEGPVTLQGSLDVEWCTFDTNKATDVSYVNTGLDSFYIDRPAAASPVTFRFVHNIWNDWALADGTAVCYAFAGLLPADKITINRNLWASRFTGMEVGKYNGAKVGAGVSWTGGVGGVTQDANSVWVGGGIPTYTEQSLQAYATLDADWRPMRPSPAIGMADPANTETEDFYRERPAYIANTRTCVGAAEYGAGRGMP